MPRGEIPGDGFQSERLRRRIPQVSRQDTELPRLAGIRSDCQPRHCECRHQSRAIRHRAGPQDSCRRHGPAAALTGAPRPSNFRICPRSTTMPTFDGGHCFLTALLPIQTCEVVDEAGLRSSHVHMVRDALAILPTAHQSPVTERLSVISPFVKSTKTHFARIAVIDDVIFNGRMATNAILDQSDRTIPQPVDQLPGPYLMVVIDFDAPQGTEAELRDYLREIWAKMAAELKPVFEHCFSFTENMNPDGFADYIIGYQIETTMPFNDYWPGPPPLKSLSMAMVAAVGVGTWALAAAALFAGLS